jgi:hypothetical protein
MRHATRWIALLVLVPLLPEVAAAQQAQRTNCQPGSAPTARTAAGPSQREQAYDVVVDVPRLCVQRISLEVDNLYAHLSLDARVANLINVQAGADVTIGTVQLAIQGVRARALLLVDLDNVVQIVDRTLTFIDNNPEVVSHLIGTVQRTVGTVGNVANTALQPGGVVSQTVGAVGQTLNNVTQPNGLLSQTVNTLGQTVQRTLDTTGNVVEKTLDTTGSVVNQRTLGSLLNLQGLNVISQTTNATGQVVRQVRDQSGAVLEYTLDTAGKIVSSRVVSGATGR